MLLRHDSMTDWLVGLVMIIGEMKEDQEDDDDVDVD